MTPRCWGLIALLCALAALAAAPGSSAAASPVISDCNANARLTRSYSVSQLQTALSTMPADVKEYTDCYDVIQRALLSRASSSHPGANQSSQNSTGSFLPTPLLVVLIVLVLAGATLGGFAVRRRRSPE